MEINVLPRSGICRLSVIRYPLSVKTKYLNSLMSSKKRKNRKYILPVLDVTDYG